MSADNWTTCPNCGEAFREDYEFYGAEDGVVEWSYRGSCRGCDLRVKFGGAHSIHNQKENL